MKRKTWIVGHFTKVQFKENHLKGKVDNENKKFKKLRLQFKFVAPLTQILSPHKSLFYNIAT
jgi:hypothetical protein